MTFLKLVSISIFENELTEIFKIKDKAKQDGAALESSSSLQRIVRIFSCQEIGDWKLDL